MLVRITNVRNLERKKAEKGMKYALIFSILDIPCEIEKNEHLYLRVVFNLLGNQIGVIFPKLNILN